MLEQRDPSELDLNIGAQAVGSEQLGAMGSNPSSKQTFCAEEKLQIAYEPFATPHATQLRACTSAKKVPIHYLPTSSLPAHTSIFLLPLHLPSLSTLLC